LKSLRYALSLLAGPLAWPTWRGRIVLLLSLALWTVLSEVGGVFAWPALGLAATLPARRRAALALVALSQVVGLVVVPPVAERFGRVPLPCASAGPLRPRSIVYCLAHRRYVRPELRRAALAAAEAVAAEHPGTVVRYLDAGFPFAGPPLLPHLSHGDARRLDLALLYTDPDGRPVDGGGSPIGYFGYVPPPGEPACAADPWDLRWDLPWLQPLLASPLDERRTAALVAAAARQPAIRRILLEPHLRRRLGLRSEKVRFQGCRAARHDDHFHLDL
jgi:hypothetical protein